MGQINTYNIKVVTCNPQRITDSSRLKYFSVFEVCNFNVLIDSHFFNQTPFPATAAGSCFQHKNSGKTSLYDICPALSDTITTTQRT